MNSLLSSSLLIGGYLMKSFSDSTALAANAGLSVGFLDPVSPSAEHDEKLLAELHTRIWELFTAAIAFDGKRSGSSSSSPRSGPGRLSRSLSITRRKSMSDASPPPAAKLLSARDAVIACAKDSRLAKLREEYATSMKLLADARAELFERSIKAEGQHSQFVAQSLKAATDEQDLKVRSARVISQEQLGEEKTVELLRNLKFFELKITAMLPLLCALKWACEPAELPSNPEALCKALLQPEGALALRPEPKMLKRFEERKKLFLGPSELGLLNEEIQKEASRWAKQECERKCKNVSRSIANQSARILDRLQLRHQTIAQTAEQFSPRERVSDKLALNSMNRLN